MNALTPSVAYGLALVRASLDKRCPTCKAKPGDPCVSVLQSPTSPKAMTDYTHIERRVAVMVERPAASTGGET